MRPGSRGARARARRVTSRSAHADRGVVRHRRAAGRADGARHRPRRRGHHEHVSRSSRPPAASRGSARRRCSSTSIPSPTTSIPTAVRGGDHAADARDHAGAPLRPVRRHGSDPRGARRSPASRSSRTRARRSARRYHGRQAGAMGIAGCFSFFPEQEPRRVRRRRAGDDQRRGAGARGPAAAQPRRRAEVHPQADRRQLPARRAAGGRAARQAAASRRAGRACGATTPRATTRCSPRPGSRAGSRCRSSPPAARHIFNQYVVRVPDRDRVRARLTRATASAPRSTTRCRSTCRSASRALGYARGDFPQAEAAAGSTLALPIYGELTAAQQAAVVGALSRALGGVMRRPRHRRAAASSARRSRASSRAVAEVHRVRAPRDLDVTDEAAVDGRGRARRARMS